MSLTHYMELEFFILFRQSPSRGLRIGFYLSGVVPLLGISLLELGAIARNRTDSERRGLHVKFVSWFLVVAHAAMILGMFNPTLFTATPAGM